MKTYMLRIPPHKSNFHASAPLKFAFTRLQRTIVALGNEKSISFSLFPTQKNQKNSHLG